MAVGYKLFDIEGVTTKVTFVHDVLFPYFLENVKSYLDANADDKSVQKTLEEVRNIFRERGQDDSQDIYSVLSHLVAEDCKDPRFKRLQGPVWARGYESGELTGHIYPDAYEKLATWNRQGIPLATFSSGSVKAQQVLFQYSAFGDIRGLFTHHIDPNGSVRRNVDGSYQTIEGPIGSKRELDAYLKIARILGCSPGQIEFYSDTKEELDAARDAGLSVFHVIRDDEMKSIHPMMRDFRSSIVPANMRFDTDSGIYVPA